MEEEEEKIEEAENDEEESEHGEEEIGDEGEALVIRRLLRVEMSQEEDWLRESIFQTRCTSYGKVCNVTIDSGSCTNVVSEEMVMKLAMKTEPHPRRYKIQRFKNGNGVAVNKRCLVSLSIGKSYQDEVWWPWTHAISCWEGHGSLTVVLIMIVLKTHIRSRRMARRSFSCQESQKSKKIRRKDRFS